ncbi:nuclear transport factor 2 family protein [Mycobacterium camsae]|uniref:nuclear transport factor 2 family protein n=1 Tax=Mycobacterium gordonae TaxID=1778 RepID=UPI00197CD847|nr:nuclear transport factor 2 family protein [Mycobacterium gordonae]
MPAPAIARWLEFMEQGKPDVLDDLLAPDAFFYSPAVFAPQEGRAKVAGYLRAAELMFCDAAFRYVAQWFDDRCAVLEFTANLEGVHIEGVDIIHWNDEDKITSFKVLVRPLKAIEVVVPKMGELLAQVNGADPGQLSAGAIG